MPLSTAVHLSARFTYVSPAATIKKKDGTRWGHLVDGGYFENSGAATAIELLIGMREIAMDSAKIYNTKVPLNLILIRNDPEAPLVCDPGGGGQKREFTPDTWATEVLSPIWALLDSRTARGRLAEDTAVKIVPRLPVAPLQNCESGCVFEFALKRDAGSRWVDPPLGWSLSAAASQRMDDLLREYEGQFKCVKEVLTFGRCSEEPPCSKLQR
jgi:hypothetical protein